MTRQPKPWVESMLVAYVDNQLEPAQMAAVEEAIREDPEARTIVAVLRRSADAVKAAFDQPMHEPVPARLLATIAAAEATATDGKIVSFPRAGVRANRRAFMALAASVAALVIGFGAGYLQFSPPGAIRLAATPPVGAETGQYEAALYQALEDGSTGAMVPYEDTAARRRGVVTIVGPVVTATGDTCREFRHEWTAAPNKMSSEGLACRSDAGDWSILTLPPKPAS